jgi:hypothetical protein
MIGLGVQCTCKFALRLKESGAKPDSVCWDLPVLNTVAEGLAKAALLLIAGVC